MHKYSFISKITLERKKPGGSEWVQSCLEAGMVRPRADCTLKSFGSAHGPSNNHFTRMAHLKSTSSSLNPESQALSVYSTLENIKRLHILAVSAYFFHLLSILCVIRRNLYRASLKKNNEPNTKPTVPVCSALQLLLFNQNIPPGLQQHHEHY